MMGCKTFYEAQNHTFTKTGVFGGDFFTSILGRFWATLGRFS